MGRITPRDNARMIQKQIIARGISDKSVLSAMMGIDRKLFVPIDRSPMAYDDCPVPLRPGATVSQPYIVALMSELLKVEPHHKVLEIGTGSGYQAAVLGMLAQEVWGVEVQPELVEYARDRLARAAVTNVHVVHGDGWEGLPENAPFDRIIVTAAPPTIPDALLEQLAPYGRMVVPVGTDELQELEVIGKNRHGEISKHRHSSVKFVPLVHPD